MYTSQNDTQTTTTYAESTKFVADILSSMANGNGGTPDSNNTFVPNFLNSGTGLTPTLTPTTLATLEQSFLELQQQQQGGARDPTTQSGFVPPVVEPPSHNNSNGAADLSQDSYDHSSSSEDDSEFEPSSAKRKRTSKNGGGIKGVDYIVTSTGTVNVTPQRKYTRRNKDEKLAPEEEERRRVRRERNKLAAAKCRQRRVDHTNVLLEETDDLLSDQSRLEAEIQTLKQEKDQLEFILQSHKPLCKVTKGGAEVNKGLNNGNGKVKFEVKDERQGQESRNSVSPHQPSHQSQNQHFHTNNTNTHHQQMPSTNSQLPAAAVSSIPNTIMNNKMVDAADIVKSSMSTNLNGGLSSSSSSAPPSSFTFTTLATPSPQTTMSSTMSSMASTRPNSLPLIKRDRARMLSITSATGVSINTPTSGISVTPSVLFCPDLGAMVDGSTGLTPITGMSCSSQVQNNSNNRSVTDTVNNPTTNSDSVGAETPNLISL